MIYTIGHSTRTHDEFFSLLPGGLLVDVRSYPGSRYCPQWNREELEKLDNYIWLPALGGRRKADPHSINTAWRNESFRGYADYMQTAEFAGGIDELVDLAAHESVTIMCAEALWWRCHRSMVADALTAAGIEVYHILDNSIKLHTMRNFAVVGETVTYPNLHP